MEYNAKKGKRKSVEIPTLFDCPKAVTFWLFVKLSKVHIKNEKWYNSGRKKRKRGCFS